MEEGKEEENKFNKVKKCKAIRIKDFRGRGYQGRIERETTLVEEGQWNIKLQRLKESIYNVKHYIRLKINVFITEKENFSHLNKSCTPDSSLLKIFSNAEQGLL